MKPLRRTLVFSLILAVALAARAATLEEEMRAVERIRGLRFIGRVHTVQLDRSELPEHLRNEFQKTLPYSTEDWVDVLHALRLVDQGTTGEGIVSSLLTLYQSQVLAYYDPPSKTFYTVKQLPDAVKDMPMAGALDAGVAIHELTHALQDQHFHIGEKDVALRDDADANLAYHAVLEGDASLAMIAYMVEQGGENFDEMMKSDPFSTTLSSAAAQNVSVEGPKYFVEMLKFPYLDGIRFVLAAYKRGGWKAIDAVYANPPQSTREIYNPDKYFAHRFMATPFDRRPPIAVPRLLSVEHLGEFNWRYLVGAENARGWVGDRETIAQNAWCEPTVLSETQWDSEEQARKFYDAYRRSLDDAGAGSLGRIDGRSVRVAYGSDRPLMEKFIAR
ncbi:MAG TPA: hypothetical protein VLU46_04935 [Thermoanaerobaculia bacterium]|nr:hypothetical protein [Thermoanaerobaculia bacterium]